MKLRIQQIMEERGLTAYALAMMRKQYLIERDGENASSGINNSCVRNLLKGEGTLAVLEEFAHVLNIPLWQMFEGCPEHIIKKEKVEEQVLDEPEETAQPSVGPDIIAQCPLCGENIKLTLISSKI